MNSKMTLPLRHHLEGVNAAIARIEEYERTGSAPDATPERRHADFVYNQWDRATVYCFQQRLARAIRGSAGVPPGREEQPAPLVYSKRRAQ